MTLFVAGTDTSGHVATIAIHYICSESKVKENLLEEINRCIKTEEDLNVDTLNKMDYLSAILKESLRIAPPAAALFPRKAIEDHTLGTLKIKKGTIVNVAICAFGSRPEIKEPAKFRPERWLNDEMKSVNNYFVIPFSAGRRNCIG